MRKGHLVVSIIFSLTILFLLVKEAWLGAGIVFAALVVSLVAYRLSKFKGLDI